MAKKINATEKHKALFETYLALELALDVLSNSKAAPEAWKKKDKLAEDFNNTHELDLDELIAVNKELASYYHSIAGVFKREVEILNDMSEIKEGGENYAE